MKRIYRRPKCPIKEIFGQTICTICRVSIFNARTFQAKLKIKEENFEKIKFYGEKVIDDETQ